jgi:arsenite methyltransferase
MTAGQTKPDYGVDAPGVIRNLFLAGVIAILIGIFFPAIRIGPVTFLMRPMTRGMGLGMLGAAVLMLIYVKAGKFRHRDRMLSIIPWTGAETVLDVGTGRGLLMIGAAKRLTTGKSFGIDIWSNVDMGGNHPDRTRRNAELEGVSDKVEIRSEDATKMSFPNNTFDVILSNLCIHNIPTKEGRRKACAEIVRVLKPGGTALISDFIRLGEYAHAFQAAGAQAERTGIFLTDTFPPLGIVRVKK